MVQALGRRIITEASRSKVSDIYILPKGDCFELYFRKSESRQFVGSYEQEEMAALIGHFKFIAGMNVGEKRRSQLGSCTYEHEDGQIAMRLSTVGDYRGMESLVIRLLYDLEQGFDVWFQNVLAMAKEVSGRGLYLFSGPVGSGKTSLMYHLANQRFQGRQVITIEDPVEIKQEHMLQLQLNETIGSTYDDLIKLSLRHRPDLLIIGEIRDSETARAVMRASLTGATVFSTIHARSIRGVYDRLLELGVTKEELNNSLQGIYYQRLLAGKGVIDFADRDFETYQPDRWNAQIEKLFAAGHLTAVEKATETIKLAPTKENLSLI